MYLADLRKWPISYKTHLGPGNVLVGAKALQIKKKKKANKGEL
jgi:hypothetical protein